MTKIDIDKVFSQIGELGPIQKRYCLVIFILNIYGAQMMLQYTFVSHEMTFNCIVDENNKNTSKSALFNTCPAGESKRCKSILFDTSMTSSIISEWKLVCDQHWIPPMTMSVFMLGVMAGSLTLGAMADWLGRKLTLSITFLLILISNGASAITSNLIIYMVLKFFHGFFTTGYILAQFVLLNELIGPTYRSIIGTLYIAFFAIGILIFSFMAYMFQHWRKLIVASTVFGIPIMILSHFLLPASPRWLQNQGKIKEAIETLKKIANGNNKTWSHQVLEDSSSGDSDNGIEITIQPHLPSKPNDSIKHLFKQKYLAMITIIQIIAWMTNALTYYALTLAAGSSDDLYLGTALSGLVELPAYALCMVSLKFFGRVTNVASYMIAAGLSLTFIIFTDSFAPLLTTSIQLFGKFCISSSFTVIYIHSNEIFPTTIRNSGMGLVRIWYSVGGLLAPHVVKLGAIHNNLHFLVLGVFCTFSGILTLKLPETKDMSLPETIEDLLSRRVCTASVQSPHVSYKKISNKLPSVQSPEISYEKLSSKVPSEVDY